MSVAGSVYSSSEERNRSHPEHKETTMTSTTTESSEETAMDATRDIGTGQDIIHCKYCGSPRIILVLRDRSNGPCGGSVQLINPDACYENGDFNEFPTVYESHCLNCHHWGVIKREEEE
jgi:hypothetical protein